MSQKYDDTRKELLENLRARIDMGGLSQKDWQDMADAAKLLGDFEDSEALHYYCLSQASEAVNQQVNTRPEKKQSFAEDKTVPLSVPDNKIFEQNDKISASDGSSTTHGSSALKDSSKDKKSKKPLLIVAMIVIIAVCGGGWYYMSMIKPVSDVKALMEEHKYDEAYDKAKEFLSKHEDSDKLNLTEICEEQLQYELDQKNFSQAYDIMKTLVSDSKIAEDNEYVATVTKEYLNSEKEANGPEKAYELLKTMLSETSIKNEDDFVAAFCQEYVNTKKDKDGYVEGHKLLKKMIDDGTVKEDAPVKSNYQTEMIAYAKSASKNKEDMKTAWDLAIYLTEQKIIENDGSEMQEIFNNEFQTAMQALSEGKNDKATSFIKSAAKKEYFKKFEVKKEDALKLSYALLNNGQDAGKIIPDGILIDLKMGQNVGTEYQAYKKYWETDDYKNIVKKMDVSKTLPIKIVEKRKGGAQNQSLWEYKHHHEGEYNEYMQVTPGDYDPQFDTVEECKMDDNHYLVYLMPGDIMEIPEDKRAKSFDECTCYIAKQMSYFIVGSVYATQLGSSDIEYTPYFSAQAACVVYSANDPEKFMVLEFDGTQMPKARDQDWFDENSGNDDVLYSDDALFGTPDYDKMNSIFEKCVNDYDTVSVLAKEGL